MRLMLATGTVSRMKSKLSLSNSDALTAFVALARNSVWPSAAARTSASVAILLAAPGRLSTMNCWPSRSDSHCPIRRAMMSIWPPAGKPTRIRTGRDG